MRTFANIAAAAFLIAVTIAIFFWARSLDGGAFNFDERQLLDWAMPILSAALTLAGVLFGALYAELQHDDEKPLMDMRRAF